jgi:tetratricopeptide (TPR) repeat protein
MRDLARRYLEAAGEWETTMWRFARAAVRIAQEIHDHYLAGGEGMLAALARFDTEAPHINAARHWATSHAGIAEGDALLLADACATFPFAGLHYDLQHELIPQLERALAATRRLNDQRSEANVLKNLGNSYTSLGEPGLAITYHEQHRAVVQALGDRGDEGRALNNLGIAYRQLGNLQRAICAFNEALVVARVLGDQHGEGCALNNLGNSYAMLGETTQAIRAYEQALALARALGHRCAERIVLCNLGQVYLHPGQAHRAMVFCEQAAAIAQALAFLALDDPPQALRQSVDACGLLRENG